MMGVVEAMAILDLQDKQELQGILG